MRIICPRCDATYDIPERAVPVSGREVQCSACTHAWYQLPPNSAIPPGPLALPPEASGGADAGPPDSARTVAEPPPPPRRKIDPDVLRVLREEASREHKARRKPPAEPLETQPDLGPLDPPARPSPHLSAAPSPAPAGAGVEGLRARLARLQAAEGAADRAVWSRGEDEHGAPAARPGPRPDASAPQRAAPPGTAAPAGPPKTGARPAAGEPASHVPPAGPRARLPVKVSAQELALIAEREQQRGFRWGFGLTAGFAAAALVCYLVAPSLAQSVPATAPLVRQVVQTGAAVQTALVEFLAPVTALVGG